MKRKAPPKVVSRTDGWENAFSGVGTWRDKSRHTRFKLTSILKPEQCEQLFAGDDLARTIVSAIVDDGMREDWHLVPVKEEGEPDDPAALERAQEIKTELEDLEASEKLRLGAIWGRCYGAGGVLLVLAGQDPSKPLQTGELVDLVDVERREIYPLTYYSDFTAKNFGKPETYTYTPFTSGVSTSPVVTIHESRLVLFGGVDTPKRIRAMNEGWDLSVLQAVYDVLKTANGNWGSVCAALADMSQAVIKMKGLINSIAMGKGSDIEARVALAGAMRSTVNALLLDAEGEEFEVVERGALTGISDVLDQTWSRLAAAAEMPVTRLMGVSPGGLNATGESDLTFWYDRVRAWQRKEMAPAILQLVGLIDDGAWEVCFPDLEKMNPKEEAELRKMVADADAVYLTNQVLLAEEVFKVRFGSGKWTNGFDGLDMATREKALAEELKAMEENAGKPEVPPGGAVDENGDPVPASPDADPTKPPADKDAPPTFGG